MTSVVFRFCLVVILALAWGLAAAETPSVRFNQDLEPAEEYRRLSLVLLVGEDVDDALATALARRAGPGPADQSVNPDALKSPLIRIVDQESMLDGTAYLFRLALLHGQELAARIGELDAGYPEEIAGLSVDALREDAILVRSAIEDSLARAGLDADEAVAGALQAYRARTLQLRDLLEYGQFERELNRITQSAIASVGGKLDAYQRMFDDEVRDDAFEQHVRAAERPYLGRQAFDKNAGKVAEEIMEAVVISESTPGG